MLSGQYDEMLAEWLAAAGAGGWRVPEEVLPDLLELGRGNPTLRAAIGPVLGERGRWLAAQNPDWAYVGAVEAVEAALDIDTLWVTNVRGMRLSLLGQLRAADPDGARERVASTWGEESAADRASFLAAFRTGLSMNDEPFLEAALDDRRKEVRQEAADLLARLPDSRLVARMIERVRPLLQYTPAQRTGLVLKRKHRARLDVMLPDACDKAMARDGVEAKPPTSLLGEKAWWLRQMLGAVPLRVWTEAWGATPDDLVAAAMDSDWKEVLIPGWALAAERQGTADWAVPLLLARPERMEEFGLSGLVDLLSPTTREELILRLLEGELKPSYGNHPVLFFLRHSRHPWSAALTRRVLALAWERSVERMVNDDYFGHSLRAELPEFARNMDPVVAVTVTRDWPLEGSNNYWARQANEFVALVQFRYDMLKDLAR
jgi:hypothetical protein